jgi:hypothetical protein
VEDYRWFERSFGATDLPNYLEGIFPHGSENKYGDLGKLLSRNFNYMPSHDQIGLQLADVLTNATRRALTGNLQQSGWRHIGRLMVKKSQTCT